MKCYGVDEVAARILALEEGSRVVIAAPLVLAPGQGIIEKLTLLVGDGLQRVCVGGETRFIEDYLPTVDPETRAEEIAVVVDRARVAPDDDTATRLRDSVARAFSYGDGVCTILTDRGAESFRRGSKPTASASNLRPNTSSGSTIRWAPAPAAKATGR